MGRSALPRGLDTCEHLAHHFDVREGGDADPLPQTSSRQSFAARLLCCKCLAFIEGVGSLCLRARRCQERAQVWGPPHWNDPRSARGRRDDSVAASSFIGSESQKGCGFVCGESQRRPDARGNLQEKRCEQENDREALSAGNRHDLWKVEAAATTNAGDAAAGRRREGYTCRPGSGIQHAERIHLHVQTVTGHYANLLLQGSSQRRIS